MSYILDALEKAEAQRAREAGDPHHVLLPPAPHVATRARGARPLAWVVGLVLALAAGWGLGLIWQDRAAAPAASPGPAQVAAPASMPPSSAPTTQGADALAPPAALAAPIAPTPTAAESQTRPQTTQDVTPTTAAPTTAAPILAPVAVAPTVPRAAAEPSPAAKPSEPRARAPTADTNQQAGAAATSPVIPASVGPLAVQGVTYSSNAALRMLIVNGQVLQEGQELAPGLSLEAIGPRSAVFNRQGHRFNVNY